ncbi:MAG: lipoprotein insertase outer membrane protein LolB [Candidatus Competibacterales bacterium]
MKRRSALSLVLGAGLLAACASKGPLDGPTFAARERALRGLTHFDLQGRVSLTRGEEGWHASLNWRQRGDAYTIDLVGPLGQGQVLITGSGDDAVLESGDRRLVADDPDALVAAATGFALPVAGLRHWVRGLPAPDGPRTLRGDPQGRVTNLQQAGWTIDYLGYQTVDALDVPRRIDARRGELRLKLVIGHWQWRA